jgi:hypothetical protein
MDETGKFWKIPQPSTRARIQRKIGRTGKDPDISQKYASITVRFGSRGNKTNKSVYLPKYAKIEPHIMPLNDPQTRYCGFFFRDLSNAHLV